jgi:hypothetical protein
VVGELCPAPTERQAEQLMLKTAPAYQRQVCDTQVIVVRSAESVDDLHAGGTPMVPMGSDKAGRRDPGPAFAEGTLSVGTTALTVKEAQAAAC